MKAVYNAENKIRIDFILFKNVRNRINKGFMKRFT